MSVRAVSKAVTTASDGSATVYTDGVVGRILTVQYIKTDFANGVDFAITAETSGQNIWTENDVNASTQRAPRQATHTAAGAAALYAAGGAAVLDYIALAGERIKIVIAAGGATKTGRFVFVIE